MFALCGGWLCFMIARRLSARCQPFTLRSGQDTIFKNMAQLPAGIFSMYALDDHVMASLSADLGQAAG